MSSPGLEGSPCPGADRSPTGWERLFGRTYSKASTIPRPDIQEDSNDKGAGADGPKDSQAERKKKSTTMVLPALTSLRTKFKLTNGMSTKEQSMTQAPGSPTWKNFKVMTREGSGEVTAFSRGKSPPNLFDRVARDYNFPVKPSPGQTVELTDFKSSQATAKMFEFSSPLDLSKVTKTFQAFREHERSVSENSIVGSTGKCSLETPLDLTVRKRHSKPSDSDGYSQITGGSPKKKCQVAPQTVRSSMKTVPVGQGKLARQDSTGRFSPIDLPPQQDPRAHNVSTPWCQRGLRVSPVTSRGSPLLSHTQPGISLLAEVTRHSTTDSFCQTTPVVASTHISRKDPLHPHGVVHMRGKQFKVSPVRPQIHGKPVLIQTQTITRTMDHCSESSSTVQKGVSLPTRIPEESDLFSKGPLIKPSAVVPPSTNGRGPPTITSTAATLHSTVVTDSVAENSKDDISQNQNQAGEYDERNVGHITFAHGSHDHIPTSQESPTLTEHLMPFVHSDSIDENSASDRLVESQNDHNPLFIDIPEQSSSVPHHSRLSSHSHMRLPVQRPIVTEEQTISEQRTKSSPKKKKSKSNKSATKTLSESCSPPHLSVSKSCQPLQDSSPLPSPQMPVLSPRPQSSPENRSSDKSTCSPPSLLKAAHATKSSGSPKSSKKTVRSSSGYLSFGSVSDDSIDDRHNHSKSGSVKNVCVDKSLSQDMMASLKAKADEVRSRIDDARRIKPTIMVARKSTCGVRAVMKSTCGKFGNRGPVGNKISTKKSRTRRRKSSELDKSVIVASGRRPHKPNPRYINEDFDNDYDLPISPPQMKRSSSDGVVNKRQSSSHLEEDRTNSDHHKTQENYVNPKESDQYSSVASLSAFMPTKSADLSPVAVSVDINTSPRSLMSSRSSSPRCQRASHCSVDTLETHFCIHSQSSDYEHSSTAVGKNNNKGKSVSVSESSTVDWREELQDFKKHSLRMPDKLIYVPKTEPPGLKENVKSCHGLISLCNQTQVSSSESLNNGHSPESVKVKTVPIRRCRKKHGTTAESLNKSVDTTQFSIEFARTFGRKSNESLANEASKDDVTTSQLTPESERKKHLEKRLLEIDKVCKKLLNTPPDANEESSSNVNETVVNKPFRTKSVNPSLFKGLVDSKKDKLSPLICRLEKAVFSPVQLPTIPDSSKKPATISCAKDQATSTKNPLYSSAIVDHVLVPSDTGDSVEDSYVKCETTGTSEFCDRDNLINDTVNSPLKCRDKETTVLNVSVGIQVKPPPKLVKPRAQSDAPVSSAARTENHSVNPVVPISSKSCGCQTGDNDSGDMYPTEAPTAKIRKKKVSKKKKLLTDPENKTGDYVLTSDKEKTKSLCNASKNEDILQIEMTSEKNNSVEASSKLLNSEKRAQSPCKGSKKKHSSKFKNEQSLSSERFDENVSLEIPRQSNMEKEISSSPCKSIKKIDISQSEIKSDVVKEVSQISAKEAGVSDIEVADSETKVPKSQTKGKSKKKGKKFKNKLNDSKKYPFSKKQLDSKKQSDSCNKPSNNRRKKQKTPQSTPTKSGRYSPMKSLRSSSQRTKKTKKGLKKKLKTSTKEEALHNRKRRSMLDELVNSDGYVAEKRFKTSDNLYADPSELSREERALQRAIMYITEMEMKSKDNRRTRQPPPTTNTKEKARMLMKNALKRSRAFFGDKNSRKVSTIDKETKKVSTQKGPKKAMFKHSEAPSEEKVPVSSEVSSKSSNKNGAKMKKSIDRKAPLDPIDVYAFPDDNEDTPIEMNISGSRKTYAKRAVSLPEGDRKETSPLEKCNISPRRTRRSKPRRKSCSPGRGQRYKVSLAWQDDYEDECELPDLDLDDDDELKTCLLAQEPPVGTFIPPSEIDTMSTSGRSETESLRYIPPEVKKVSKNMNTGETVLHRAARLGYEEVTLWVAENQYCDLNAKDYAGFAPLHETCVMGHVTIAKILIDHGADVNVSSTNGIRPIHDAVENDHFELVRLFLACGADPTLTSYTGRTLISMAKTPEMKTFLKGYMYDISGGKDARGNKEESLEWEFEPSYNSLEFRTKNKKSPNGKKDTKESIEDSEDEEEGFDILGNPPSEDDDSELEFEFDLSDLPHLQNYYISVNKKRGPLNYLILDDVLQRLCLDREQFAKRHPEIKSHSVRTYLLRESLSMRGIPVAPNIVHAESGRNGLIEVVELGPKLNDILGVASERISTDIWDADENFIESGFDTSSQQNAEFLNSLRADDDLPSIVHNSPRKRTNAKKSKPKTSAVVQKERTTKKKSGKSAAAGSKENTKTKPVASCSEQLPPTTAAIVTNIHGEVFSGSQDPTKAVTVSAIQTSLQPSAVNTASPFMGQTPEIVRHSLQTSDTSLIPPSFHSPVKYNQNSSSCSNFSVQSQTQVYSSPTYITPPSNTNGADPLFAMPPSPMRFANTDVSVSQSFQCTAFPSQLPVPQVSQAYPAEMSAMQCSYQSPLARSPAYSELMESPCKGTNSYTLSSPIPLPSLLQTSPETDSIKARLEGRFAPVVSVQNSFSSPMYASLQEALSSPPRCTFLSYPSDLNSIACRNYQTYGPVNGGLIPGGQLGTTFAAPVTYAGVSAGPVPSSVDSFSPQTLQRTPDCSGMAMPSTNPAQSHSYIGLPTTNYNGNYNSNSLGLATNTPYQTSNSSPCHLKIDQVLGHGEAVSAFGHDVLSSPPKPLYGRIDTLP